jgi:hypothetical protein
MTFIGDPVAGPAVVAVADAIAADPRCELPMERCGAVPLPTGSPPMNLDRARELRQELDAIEATMQRIKVLAEELPTADELENLADVVRDSSSHLDHIVQQTEKLPAPTGVRP